MGKSSKTAGGKPRPDGELRQSQMITTCGPGALVDLVNDAILIPGLDYWSDKGASRYDSHTSITTRRLPWAFLLGSASTAPRQPAWVASRP